MALTNVAMSPISDVDFLGTTFSLSCLFKYSYSPAMAAVMIAVTMKPLAMADNHVAFLRYGLDENTFENDQGGALTPDVFNGSSTNEGWSLLGNLTSTWGTVLNELTLHTTEF